MESEAVMNLHKKIARSASTSSLSISHAPCTKQETDQGCNELIEYAVCAMKGWREEMEDFRCAHLTLNGRQDVYFFGVFDGHRGKDIARFASENLHTAIVDQDAFQAAQYDKALKAAFMQLDNDLMLNSHIDHNMSGSTAATCLFVGDVVYCANAGDSRVVLSREGKAVDLSRDHHPILMSERIRIERAGGTIHQHRIQGELSLARSFGDQIFKNGFGPSETQQVIALPDVIVHRMDQCDDFLLLATDGIWDVVSSQAAVDLIRRELSAGRPPQDALTALVDHCLAKPADSLASQTIASTNPTPAPPPPTHAATAPPQANAKLSSGCLPLFRLWRSAAPPPAAAPGDPGDDDGAGGVGGYDNMTALLVRWRPGRSGFLAATGADAASRSGTMAVTRPCGGGLGVSAEAAAGVGLAPPRVNGRSLDER